MKVLIIDDEREFAGALARSLRAQGHELGLAHLGSEGLVMAGEFLPDAVLLDINMPEISGLQLLPDLLRKVPNCSVVMITGLASHKSAVQAMKEGAEDYIEKPFDPDELQAIMTRIQSKVELKTQLGELKQRRIEDYGREYFFLTDPAMQKIYKDLEEVAPRDMVTVLIQGETGTGKEHVARLLHLFSNRSSKPFVELHCAALPETLLESELFGHEAGAFTDARSRKKGLFETAEGGTLFLDEIGELSLGVQAKLLKVLEERSMRRLGGIETIKLDVRLVTASNRDLSAEASAGRFRQDLYYRLNVFPVRMPPLRDRPADLRGLADYFYQRAAKGFEKKMKPLDEDALQALSAHSWPGNVRELKNFMERLLLSARGDRVSAEEIRAALPAQRRQKDVEISKSLLESTLKKTGGDKSRAAAELGISRPTLYRHLKKYGILV